MSLRKEVELLHVNRASVDRSEDRVRASSCSHRAQEAFLEPSNASGTSTSHRVQHTSPSHIAGVLVEEYKLQQQAFGRKHHRTKLNGIRSANDADIMSNKMREDDPGNQEHHRRRSIDNLRKIMRLLDLRKIEGNENQSNGYSGYNNHNGSNPWSTKTVQRETKTMPTEPSVAEFESIKSFLKKGQRAFYAAQQSKSLPDTSGNRIWEILPYLYVGGKEGAEDAELLTRTGITHVINCAPQSIGKPPIDLPPARYVELHMEDFINSEVIDFIPPGLEVVKDAMDTDGKCFVHCYQGINRSVFIILAAILKLSRLPQIINPVRQRKHLVGGDCVHARRLLEAWAIVAKSRQNPPVLTNPAFFRQLYLWLRFDMIVENTPRWEVLESEWDKFIRGIIKSCAGNHINNIRNVNKRALAHRALDDVTYSVSRKVLEGQLGPLKNLVRTEGQNALKSFVYDQMELAGFGVGDKHRRINGSSPLRTRNTVYNNPVNNPVYNASSSLE